MVDAEAGPMREREGPSATRGDINKSRPESRAGERADNRLERHDQSSDDKKPGIDVRTRILADDNDSDGDSNDEEYADDSDATDSDTERHPHVPKRRRREKSREDITIIASSASDVVSFTNATDGSN